MSNIIKNLWYGNIGPVSRFGENNPEMKEMEALMFRNREKLEKLLDDKAKEILEKYNDCVNDYIELSAEQAFCDGFCLGVKITAEALTQADQIL